MSGFLIAQNPLKFRENLDWSATHPSFAYSAKLSHNPSLAFTLPPRAFAA
jgi:hypothetical protein